ncbi:hypothetical protein GC163_17640 [bacterium]|nr:hypothetical protein [bacterium]
MFGFLRGGKTDRIFRQAYARCCRTQHRDFGLTSLVFLSYEGVFSYLLSIDAGWTPVPDESSPLCCRLRQLKSGETPADYAAARFASVVGLTLAAVKIEDDLRDSRSWAAWLAEKWYHRRFRRVRDQLETWEPDICERLRSIIGEHLKLETSSRPMAISEYVEPTAHAFATLFAVLPQACGQEGNQHRDTLAEIAADVGRAIIAFDCAVDWPWDRQRGQFNPLPDEPAVEAARLFAADCLERARQRCLAEFGAMSHAGRVLQTVRQRVLQLNSARHWPSCQRTKERWGLLREPGFTYAKCDCPCDGCAGACDAGCIDPACCDLGACGCEAAAEGGCCQHCGDCGGPAQPHAAGQCGPNNCDAGCGGCWCDPCCYAVDPCCGYPEPPRDEKKKTTTAALADELESKPPES